jgi:hypothetical protein
MGKLEGNRWVYRADMSSRPIELLYIPREQIGDQAFYIVEEKRAE